MYMISRALITAILLACAHNPLCGQASDTPEAAAVAWAATLVRDHWKVDGQLALDVRQLPSPSRGKYGSRDWAGLRGQARTSSLAAAQKMTPVDVDQIIKCGQGTPPGRCTMQPAAAVAISDAEPGAGETRLIRVRLWEKSDSFESRGIAVREFELSISPTDGGWRVVGQRLMYSEG